MGMATGRPRGPWGRGHHLALVSCSLLGPWQLLRPAAQASLRALSAWPCSSVLFPCHTLPAGADSQGRGALRSEELVAPGVLCWRPPGQRIWAQSGGRQQGAPACRGTCPPAGPRPPRLHGFSPTCRDGSSFSSFTAPLTARPGLWPGWQSFWGKTAGPPPGGPPRLGVKVQLLLGGAVPPPSGWPTPSQLRHRNKGLRALTLSPCCSGPSGGACACGMEVVSAGGGGSEQWAVWVSEAVGSASRMRKPQALGTAQAAEQLHSQGRCMGEAASGL